METGRDHVRFGRVGREYVSAPPTSPEEPYEYVGAVERLAATIEAGSPSRAGGRRGAHVVAVCNAIEAAAGGEGPVVVDDCGATAADPPPAPVVRPATTTESDAGRESEKGPGAAAIRLPAVGFGCSRYRDGEYVDRVDSIATALDAGYLLDSAELYGNEHRIGSCSRAGRAGPRARVPPRKGVAYQSPPRTPARRLLRWQPRGAGDRRVRLLRAPLAVGARTPGRAESSRREAG